MRVGALAADDPRVNLLPADVSDDETATRDRFRLRGVASVLAWHAVGLALIAVPALVRLIALSQEPGGLEGDGSDGEWFPRWFVLAVFVAGALAVLAVSLVIALVTMAVLRSERRRMTSELRSVDWAAHGLSISVCSVVLSLSALVLMLVAVSRDWPVLGNG